MSHPLKGKLSIDVDDQIGIGNIGGIRIDGRKIAVAFFEPAMPGMGDAPRGDAATLKTWRGFTGKVSGLRFVPHNWAAFNGLDGSAAAKLCSDYITKVEADAGRLIGKPTDRIVDVVEWDVETHDLAWQKEFLLGRADEDDSGSWTKGIRGRGGHLPDPALPQTLGYRWGRPGVWTMEGRQDTTTSEAALAAETGLLVGPQLYDGLMTELWDWHFELETWVLNTNPDRPNGARIPITSMLPYLDVRKEFRPRGVNESVLFATSRAA